MITEEIFRTLTPYVRKCVLYFETFQAGMGCTCRTTLRPTGDHTFEVCSGHRRMNALQRIHDELCREGK